MERQIITIDEDKCNGCGLCAQACHEGAIGMINDKARLLRDDYCDGLGNCLPVCPTGAIRFEKRRAAAFDQQAVQQHLAAQRDPCDEQAPIMAGCPGRTAHAIQRGNAHAPHTTSNDTASSELMQWPVQIKLVPVNAAYFNDAHLLIAADCTAFSFAGFHQRFMRNRITLIGCPKLDSGDYAKKLCDIIRGNEIKSITVVRMDVPCCGGIEQAVKQALMRSKKMIPWQVVVVSTDGRILTN